MSIQTGTIIEILYLCDKVYIKFDSVTSEGKSHEGHFTLKGKRIKRQSNATDTLVAWDVDNNCWQDIRVSSIQTFVGVPNEDKGYA